MYFQKNNVGSIKVALFWLHIFNGAGYVKKVWITDNENASDKVPRGKLWNIMNKWFPDHILKTVQSLYINTRIKNDKGTLIGNKEIHTNQGVK
jgi:hypothetical protein